MNSITTNLSKIPVQTAATLASDVQIPRTGPHFHDVLTDQGLELTHQQPNELQINLGKLCNLACHHCHVDARDVFCHQYLPTNSDRQL